MLLLGPDQMSESAQKQPQGKEELLAGQLYVVLRHAQEKVPWGAASVAIQNTALSGPH